MSRDETDAAFEAKLEKNRKLWEQRCSAIDPAIKSFVEERQGTLQEFDGGRATKSIVWHDKTGEKVIRRFIELSLIANPKKTDEYIFDACGMATVGEGRSSRFTTSQGCLIEIPPQYDFRLALYRLTDDIDEAIVAGSFRDKYFEKTSEYPMYPPEG